MGTIEQKFDDGLNNALKHLLGGNERKIPVTEPTIMLSLCVGNIERLVEVPKNYAVCTLWGSFRWRGLIPRVLNAVHTYNKVNNNRVRRYSNKEQLFTELVREEVLEEIRNSVVFEDDILSPQCSQELTEYIHSVRNSVLNTVLSVHIILNLVQLVGDFLW